MTQHIPAQLTLFAEDSHARISASQTQGIWSALREREAASGRSFSSKFKATVLHSQSLKTLLSCEPRDLTASSVSSARSGMMRSGIVYQLQPLTRRILGTEYGLLPTPLASETGYRRGKFSQGGTSLSTHLGGRPNPTFVEWLMGFPINHTDCGR